MCRHREKCTTMGDSKIREKIRKEFINIFNAFMGWVRQRWVELLSKISDITRPDLISSVSQPTSCHSQTDPTASFHQKRLFFHLKSWVVSCIVMEWQSTEHEVGEGGRQKKTSSQEGNLCYVMIFFSCFWKQRQKRKAENSPRRENYFSFALSCAPRQKLWWKKEILFISKAHRESFMRLF